MGPGDLSEALAPLAARPDDPRLLVGRETFDDAGVFRVADDLALVQTVDFFAPIVDDPETFGAIAAANALSDVYAMGGEPLTALTIAAFPTGKLPLAVLTAILAGGEAVVREAGAVVVGGHTVTDDEVKYGLAVTGRADPRRLLTNAAAVPGDRLVLTKALGTGLVATAVKKGVARPGDEAAMVASMRTLNAAASRGALAVGVRCATDVTGFGLLGHASHVARASAVTLHVDVARLPVLPGAREAWAAGMRTGGAARNADYVAPLADLERADAWARALLTDPQTSGGLLVAVPGDRLGEYLARVPGAAEIGEVLPRGPHAIVVG